MNEYLADQILQYRTIHEDYSQWLGSLLRNCENNCKNEEWYQKSAGMAKNMRSSPKRTPEPKNVKKAGDSKNKTESSCWVQSGEVLLNSTEEGQAEILFEAVEQTEMKAQSLEKLKSGIQQLERVGLGKDVNYITLILDDVPAKIVVRPKNRGEGSENFTFAAAISVPALLAEMTDEQTNM
jgi:hypothetical protein